MDYKQLLNLANTIEAHKNIIPKYIKMNEDYLNKLLNDGTINDITFSSGGNIEAGFTSYFTGIQVVIDNEIETYEIVLK